MLYFNIVTSWLNDFMKINALCYVSNIVKMLEKVLIKDEIIRKLD